MSFPEDAYSTNPIGASEQEVAETIVSARKSWKTVKGKSEPVWPPALEKALVKALLQYKPSDSRYARALGRFPKRNRFISDFIYEETGVRRTPKQVGSRLQQLKDVGCGKQLLNHVASWSLAAASNGASGSSSTDVNNLNISIHNAGNDTTHSPNGRLPPSSASYGFKSESSGSPSLTSTFYSPASSYGSLPVTPMATRREVFITYDPMSALAVPMIDPAGLEPVKRFTGCLGRPESVAPIDHAGCTVLPRTKPCVVFAAREPIAAYAVTTVRFENGGSPQMMPGGAAGGIATDRPITLQSPLVCSQSPIVGAAMTSRSPYAHDVDVDPRSSLSHSHQPDCFMYTTDLTSSRIWDSLIRDRNLSRCIITQDLICNMDNSAARRGEVFLSITYRFSPLPPSSPAGSLGNMHGPISPTSSSSGSTRSSPLSGSPQSTVHAQLPSYQTSYQGSGGSYNFQQTQYNGGYEGYAHHVSQLPSHSPHMGAIKTSPRLDMHMPTLGGPISFALESVGPSPILSPGGTPPSFARMGAGLPTGPQFSLEYGYATSPVDSHFGMGSTF